MSNTPKSKLRIIILHHMPTNYLKASYAYLDALSSHLDGEVVTLDAYHADITCFSDFDVVILHYSVLIVRDGYLTPVTRKALQDYKGIKILIIQDEYRWINDTVSCMQFLEFDLLLTCMPENYIEAVYPHAKLPNLKKVNVLTGYVYDEMRNFPVKNYEERKLDVVYRAHKLSAWYGRLGREKWQIAEAFSNKARHLPIKIDVSYLSEDRIYGDKWIDFLCSSKCALGTESGASVFDFDDTIRKKVEKFEMENHNITFEEIEEKFFQGLDGKIKQNQISPRIFEYAACRNLMILFEGQYSRIIQPMEHFLPLKKDFSNFDEIIALIQDEQVWKRITDKTYTDLILSEKYSYKIFVEKLNSLIDDLVKLKSPSSSIKHTKNFHCDPKMQAESRRVGQQVEKAAFAKKSYLYSIIASLVSKMPKPIINVTKTIINLFQKYKAKRFLRNPKLSVRENDILCFAPDKHKEQEFTIVYSEKICSICRWAIKGQS